MDAEFQFHLETQINDYVAQGLNREEAEARARREFGGLDLAKEECRDQRPFEWLDHVLRDFRYASRSLRKSPGFTAAAILTLALAIGANTAIFSALEGAVLEPLPYRDPDRLMFVALYNRPLKSPMFLSYPDFLDWQQSSRSFQQIAAFNQQAFDLTSPGVPEHVQAKEISSNFFRTLGVNLALGRELSPEEDRIAGPPAVVISDHLWRDRFAGSPTVLGKTVTLNGADYTITGVLTPGFHLDEQQADVYTALARSDPVFLTNRAIHNIACIVRLQPQVSIDQAQAELNTVQEHIDQLYPDTDRGMGAYVAPLKQFLVGDVSGILLLLLGAVGLLLLIACANVANLLLARSAARTREFAVRLALGASRMQIVQQLVTESVLLSLIGGILGLVFAKWGFKAALAVAPVSLPRIENIGMNSWVLLFALGISTMVGMVFGLVPALKSAKTDPQLGLKDGGRGSAGGHQRMQRVLVLVQIALTLVLLTGGSLLFRTIHNLWTVNPGFDARHVITFQVGLSSSVTNTASKERIAYEQLVERIRDIPGVEAADISADVALSGHRNEGPFWRGSQQPASLAEIPRAIWYPIGPDYVSTMKIPLLRGRLLSKADKSDSQLVVLIDGLLARIYFPDGDAVGQTITLPQWGYSHNVAARIVGVVGHVEHYALDGSLGEKPQIYYSFYQLPDEAVPFFGTEVTLAVRTPLDVAAVMPAIKKAVYEAGSDQPVYNVQTMQELVSRSMGRQRFPTVLLVAFAGLALVLASVGTYGVISYSTNQRMHEIGIRMALGAKRGDVLRMIVGQGVRLAFVGIAIGISAALVLGRALPSFSHLLYGVGANDPLTFAGTSFVLMSTAILACYVPARRAARLDPMIALRQE
jgi:predicted permease